MSSHPINATFLFSFPSITSFNTLVISIIHSICLTPSSQFDSFHSQQHFIRLFSTHSQQGRFIQFIHSFNSFHSIRLITFTTWSIRPIYSFTRFIQFVQFNSFIHSSQFVYSIPFKT